MPRVNQAIQWNGLPALSLGPGAVAVSDDILIADTAFDAGITVRAAHSGTPAAGDVVDIYLALSADGAGFDSDQEMNLIFLGALDLAADRLDGSSPGAGWQAQSSFPSVPVVFGKARLVTRNRGALSVNVSAGIVTLGS